MRGRIDGKAKPPGSLGGSRISPCSWADPASRPAPRRQGGAAGVRRRPWPHRRRRVAISFRRDGGDGDDLSGRPRQRQCLCRRQQRRRFALSMPAWPRICPLMPDLIAAKIRMGTANAAREPAMTPQQATTRWREVPDRDRCKSTPAPTSSRIGEMGIGNTASSALLAHRLAPAPLDDCIGVGAGQDDAGMARKRAAIEKRRGAQQRHRALRCASRIRRAGNRDDGRRGAGHGVAAPAGIGRRIHFQRRGAGGDPALSRGARLLHLRASFRREGP